MAAADDKLIEDSALGFSHRLHLELPLRHFGEVHDLEQLTKVVNVIKNNVFRKVFDKIWPREKEEIASLLKNLNRRMDKVVVEWVTRNREHEIQSVSFLQKWVDFLCENFNEALEYHLLLNPGMEIDFLKNYISSKKLNIINVFESIWKPGTSPMQEERKSKLEKHLKAKEEETLEKQKRNLESKSADEGKKLLGEVGAVLLERSRQLKSYVDKHQGGTSKTILKGMVEEMLQYLLTGKGISLRETHQMIYGKLLESLEGEVKFLKEPEKKITAEDVVSDVKRFDEKLRSYCFDTEGCKDEEQDIQGQDPLRLVALEEMLNEFEEERSPEPDDGDNGQANGNHCGIQVDEDEVMHMGGDKKTSTAPKKGISRRRQFAKDGDSIMTCDASSNEVPPSRKAAEKTGCIQRRESARQMKSRKSKSVQATSSGGSGKKMSPDLDSSMTIANNGKDINHPIIDEDGIQIKNGVVSPEQSYKGTRDKKKNNNEVGDSPPKREKPRKDRSMTKKRAEDKCPVRRSTRSRNSSETTRALRVNSRKKRDPFVVKMKTKKTKDDDEFQTEECELSSPDPMQPSSRKTSGKKLKRRQIGAPACPAKITLLPGDPPKYQCNVCKRKFRLKDSYLSNYHGNFCHEKNRPYVCTECGKGFFQTQHLAAHSRTHTGEKPLKCPKCSMGFRQIGHLARHLRIHTGEKPYQCTECPMRFTRHNYLKIHALAHDRGTRFVCEACNEHFVSAQAFHNHNLTHKEKLPFDCIYCKQHFARLDVLKEHVIIHSVERPYQCSTCAISRNTKFGLVRHYERVHGHAAKEAIKIANGAALEYLLRETGNQSCRDIPESKINSEVLKYIINKANLQLPDRSSVVSGESASKNK